MSAPQLVRPITCRRCKGTGVVSNLVRRVHLGVPGGCLACNLAGVVEGDRATLAARKAEAAAFEARWAQAVAWFATQPRDVRHGFDLLECLEPERAVRALDSILTGHPGVADALVAYFTPENSARAYDRNRPAA